MESKINKSQGRTPMFKCFYQPSPYSVFFFKDENIDPNIAMKRIEPTRTGGGIY